MLAELARGGREVFPLYVRAGLMWERHELGALQATFAASRCAAFTR